MSKEMQMRAEPCFEGPREDVEAIRKIHRQWWSSNHGLVIPKMKECFASQYLMWNLNGHPYYGLDEKVKLWQHYKREIEIPEPVCVWDLRITANGDLGYLTCEGILPVRAIGSGGTGVSSLSTGGTTVPFRFRETSVYRRSGGASGESWKMWHFHCSPLAPEDEPRPGFGDTWIGRGGDAGGKQELT